MELPIAEIIFCLLLSATDFHPTEGACSLWDLHLPLPTCPTLESQQGTFLPTKTGTKAFFLGYKSEQTVKTVVGKAMEIENYTVQFPNSLFLI